MRETRPIEPEPPVSESQARSQKARRRQTGVRALIALVICCGIVFWAGRSLWESQHPAIAAAGRLRSSSSSERVTAIRDLMELGTGDGQIAIPPLMIALADTETAVRVAAAEGLSMFGSDAVKSGVDDHQVRAAVAALSGTLQDRQPAVRVAAANALGMIARCDRAQVLDLRPAAATLVAMLDDGNAEVHLAAVAALGFVGPRGLVAPPPSIVAALEDESSQLRIEAVEALANFTRGLTPLLPSLLLSMERARPEARASYARLLKAIEPPSFSANVVPHFVVALESRDPEIRSLVVSRLVAFKQDARAAVPALLKLLGEPVEFDPFEAWDTPANQARRSMPYFAARALGQIARATDQTEPVVAALMEAIRSGSPVCRAAAARCLGDFGADAVAATPVLMMELERAIAAEKSMTRHRPSDLMDSDYPCFNANAIAFSLGEIAPGTSSADVVVAFLTRALQSDSFASHHVGIMIALCEFGPKSRVAIPRLRELQKHPEQRVRQTANYALQRLERL
jgi:HEAT repeat protein